MHKQGNMANNKFRPTLISPADGFVESLNTIKFIVFNAFEIRRKLFMLSNTNFRK